MKYVINITRKKAFRGQRKSSYKRNPFDCNIYRISLKFTVAWIPLTYGRFILYEIDFLLGPIIRRFPLSSRSYFCECKLIVNIR